MPGTLVQDANELTNLLDPSSTPGTAGVNIVTSTTTTGNGVELDRPQVVRFQLSWGTVAGTNPTLDVEMQGSDTANFSSTVSYGRFSQKTTGGGPSYLEAYVKHAYVRAVAISAASAGSPTFDLVKVLVVEPNFLRVKTDTA